ncbi:hypothetical protein [Muriicola sp.]|uniref:hypothetical protein n=1 Tax=Muriicola sp. TaxID=2020856 RepID=UPI003C76065E
MRKILFLVPFFLVVSCIPFKIAPNIEDYKIVVAKRFKRDLPRQFAYVFEDKKDADEFYHFMNLKYQLGYENVELNVPVVVRGQTYFMSFYEREKTTEVANLVPILIDGILNSEGHDPILEEVHTTGNSSWYIVITVMDANFNDCLDPTFLYQKEVISYLQLLKYEYQDMHQYVEALLKK